MNTLNPKQRQYLKGLAHSLKPILQIGKAGITDTVLRSIENLFNSRELLKVRVPDTAPEDADTSAEKIVSRLQSVELVQVIGKTIVLYRPHPDKPEIKLPIHA
ncbi:MAG TPA: ribosome assembly RNA-binding protein YhbY [Blastocatellia bacterium]|nr:ribosome assembly RNA-binding protein YhbY [Blastocatellia bacterium]